MSEVLDPVIYFYRTILDPVKPLSSWIGAPLTMMDFGAAFRLCMLLRQVREQLRTRHLEAAAKSEKGNVANLEQQSFVRHAATTLLVVYGGEAITGPYLGVPPSFMVSGVIPILYIGMQAFVEYLADVQPLTLNSELPLAMIDGLTRAYLLCNLIPPAVLTHSSSAVSESPWTLLLTSLLTANAGFFFVNLFSFLQPYALTLTTPAELQPYGWGTTDLWCAPLITAIYATLTHAQPYWASLHAALFGWVGAASKGADGLVQVAPVDPEYARAFCAVLLMGMFAVRTWKAYSGQFAKAPAAQPKVKIQ